MTGKRKLANSGDLHKHLSKKRKMMTIVEDTCTTALVTQVCSNRPDERVHHESLTATGLCNKCHTFYGVAENSGRCSHCYSYDGIDTYRKIALKHMRLEFICQELASEYRITPQEKKGLILFIKKYERVTGLICSGLLWQMLCTKLFFSRKVLLDIEDAYEIMSELKTIRFCNKIMVENFIFLPVYNYWKMNADKLIFYCKNVKKDLACPKSKQDLLNLLDQLMQTCKPNDNHLFRG